MPHEGHYCCLLVGSSFPLSLGRSVEGGGGKVSCLILCFGCRMNSGLTSRKEVLPAMKRFTGLDILYKDFKVHVL